MMKLKVINCFHKKIFIIDWDVLQLQTDNWENNILKHRSILIYVWFATSITGVDIYVVRCAIWYHLYKLKNVKNTHGGELILVMLQAKAWN